MLNKFEKAYMKIINEQTEQGATEGADELASISARLVGKNVTGRSLSIIPNFVNEPDRPSPVEKYDKTTIIKSIQAFPKKSGGTSYKVRFGGGQTKDFNSIEALKRYADELESKPSLEGRYNDGRGEYYSSYNIEMIDSRGWPMHQVLSENAPSWSEFADKAREFISQFIAEKQKKLDDESKTLNSLLDSLE